LRDKARGLWRFFLTGDTPEGRESSIQRFRNSRVYQRFIYLLKWYVLPDWVITPVAMVVLGWLLLSAFVQASLPLLENGTTLCRPSENASHAISRVVRTFRTRDVCSESFGLVREGQSYAVTFDVVEPWHDASLPATPEGLSNGEFPRGLGYLAAPLKRVVNANYLQPLIEIRPAGSSRVQIYPLEMRQVGDSSTQFRAGFNAARDGELFIFVNDAMLPFTREVGGVDFRYFYENSGDRNHRGNRGIACVTVESTESATAAPDTLARDMRCQ
jgi:hypothetical protein